MSSSALTYSCVKVLAGNLFGEEDHPQYEQGMSEAQWIERNEWIETRNVCMHTFMK